MKIGIVGTGKIVDELLSALLQVEDVSTEAIYPYHNRDKAKSLAAAYNINKVYIDYEDMLADEGIDFIYIALVNSAHYKYAKDALLAHKHVIVEKPFTTEYAAAEELFDIACCNHLFLFEAVTLFYTPTYQFIQESLPLIGTPKLIHCNYSQRSSRYDRYLANDVAPAFDPELGGGALMDINIYNINFIIGLFGAPKSLEYVANIGFNGIDTSGFLVLKYDNFIAHCTGAKDSESPSFLMIQGDNGFMRVNSAPNLLSSLEINIRGREVETMNLNQFDHRMVHEFIEFAETFENKAYDKMKQSLETSIIVVNAAETAIKNAGLHYGDKI